MALPRKLMAARLSNSAVANLIDDNTGNDTPDLGGIGSLESALADIFGFTLDVDITASPFSLDNSGRITKALVAQRAVGPVGWRLRDTTSGSEVRLAVSGTNFVIDENTGTEDTPVWTNRFSMAIATGALTGALATASRMGLCPAGDGDSSHFLDGTLSFSTPAATSVPSVRVRNSAAQSIPTGSTTTLTFDTEDFDTDTMHSTVTNTSRITCNTAGKYLVIGQVTFASNATGYRQVQILWNGLTVIGRTTQAAVNGAVTSMQVVAIVNLVATGILQLQVLQNSGSALNVNASASYSPVFAAYKIG